MSENTFAKIVAGLAESIAPLKEALSDQDKFATYFFKFGYAANALPSQYSALLATINSIKDKLDNLDLSEASVSDILLLISDIKTLYDSIAAINTVPSGITDPNFLSKLPSLLFTNLLYEYFLQKSPTIGNLFVTLGIIKFVYHPSTANFDAHTTFEFDQNRLKQYFSEPTTAITDVIKWNTPSFIANDVFPYLKNLLNSIGFPAVIMQPNGSEYFGVPGPNRRPSFLRIPLLYFYAGNTPVEVGFEIHNINSTGSINPGIALLPYFPTNLSGQISITDNLSFEWSAGSNLSQLFGIVFQPGQNISIRYPNSITAPLNADLGFDVKYTFEESAILLGKPQGSRLQLKGISIGFDLAYYNNEAEFVFNLNLKDLEIVLSSSEGDSFINKILDGEKRIPIDLGVMWSSKSGLHFTGSGGFEFEVPTKLKLGPISIEGLKIRLYAQTQSPGGINVDASASINAAFGPVQATVKDIGIRMQTKFDSGNVGPFDLKIAFKPPTGIGISIDADPVSGGGFLNFDESTATYTGGLELNFSKISLKAIGILTTKMPDGGDGFSLLIIITAEFTPIQLGMGFTLNGVGGLLGWNRTMNTDRLRTGIKDNTLDSILFPQDIVKNANVIISNIGQAFPIKRDRFIIGPMAKLGWGTPTLITIEIGVLIEVPTPVVIAIVGVIKALLPSDNNRIIAIQVNFLGVIDFGKKYLSFDASLFDSKILFFSLYGDMALRMYWGDKPNFLLSVGGFHPKFTPPPMNLPQMQRLAIELANSNNLKIRIETYFAVTSNSAQFGARLEARAKAWKIEAIGALWFDILFQFSPFYFNANMGAMFAIKMGSRELLSIYLELNLEGPNPWRAQGRASFKVLGVRVNVSFDKTFGQVRVEPIEMAELWGKFNDAVLNKDSWEVIGPDRSHQTVAFREVPDGNTDLVIDPFGALRFNQKLVPMNISLSKYGTAKIKDVNKFQVTSLVLTDADNNTQTITPTITQDYFARNEFFYMTDDEKLSKESYERFDSGFSIGSTDEIYVSAYTNRVCAYEDITIDTRPDWRFRLVAANAIDLDVAMFDRHVSNNYVSEAKLSNSSAMVIADGPQSTKVLQEEYFVMNRNTMQKVQGYNLDDKYDNAAAADIALGAARNGWPADAANFIVVNSFELQTL